MNTTEIVKIRMFNPQHCRMVTKTTALPTLVVIDSFDRRVSSDFVMYERNEDEVDAVLKEIIASLNT